LVGIKIGFGKVSNILSRYLNQLLSTLCAKTKPK